jgi:hypothetical protein
MALSNPHQKSKRYKVRPPRHLGRGRALDSTGATRLVGWASGQVQVDGVNVFALAAAPDVLDLSFDALDRPVVCWRTAGGVGLVRFFDPVPNAYVSLDCGALKWPAICNDYRLLGNDIVLAYLINNVPHYRLHTEKFATPRQLTADKMEILRYFGEGVDTNSLNAVGLRK